MIQRPFKTKINLRPRDYLEQRDDPDVSLLPPDYDTLLEYVKFEDAACDDGYSTKYTPNGKWKFDGEPNPSMECEITFSRLKFLSFVFMEMPDHLLDYYLIERHEPLFGDHFLKAKFGKNSYTPFDFLSIGMGFHQPLNEKDAKSLRSSVAQYNRTHDAKLTVRRQPSELDYYRNTYYVFRYQ